MKKREGKKLTGTRVVDESRTGRTSTDAIGAGSATRALFLSCAWPIDAGGVQTRPIHQYLSRQTGWKNKTFLVQQDV